MGKREIIISDFSGGAVQHADLEDLDPNEMAVIKNMRSIRGKLIKTFGLNRAYPDTNQITDAKNITTFVHPKLIGQDYTYIGMKTTSNVLTLRQWETTGVDSWNAVGPSGFTPLNIENLFSTGEYVHQSTWASGHDSINPIVFHDQTLRILPGRIGQVAISLSAEDTDATSQFFTVSGAHYAYSLYPGLTFVLSNSGAGNDGTYRILYCTPDFGTDLAYIYVDQSYKTITGDETGVGDIAVNRVGRGLWIGYIDRDYFDENYSPTSGFYNYGTPLDPPNLDALGIQFWTYEGDNCFAPRDMEVPIETTDSEGSPTDSITIAGAYSTNIYPGSFIEVVGNSTIFGLWEVSSSEAIVDDAGVWKTKIHLTGDLLGNETRGFVRFSSGVTSYAVAGEVKSSSVSDSTSGNILSDFSSILPVWIQIYGEEEAFRMVEATMAQDRQYQNRNVGTRNALKSSDLYSPNALGPIAYYKFSYIYDGDQESMLSKALKVQYFPTSFAGFYFTITEAEHNLRIVATNVYRSASKDGPYAHALHIDFLREDKKFDYAASGCYTMRRKIYIPALDGTAVTANPTVLIKLQTRDMTGWDTFTVTGSSSTGEFNVTVDQLRDYWDCSYKISVDNGADDYEAFTGDGGCYSGYSSLLLPQSLGEESLSGGVIVVDPGLQDATTIALFSTLGSFNNIIANAKRAIHVSRRFGPAVDDGEWLVDKEFYIVRPSNGLYLTDTFNVSGDSGYMFFDTNIPAGRGHPFPGEVSVDINGALAKVIAGRLVQANIVLDPAGVAEEHRDWASFSVPGQFDNNPVSNIMRFPDREGGEMTGVAELFGNAVFMKRQSIRTVNMTGPPPWRVIETAHNIGNIAPYGSVEGPG
ncbi:hypothetical protein LCGC14_1420620, partial [marine sediment metagenome]